MDKDMTREAELDLKAVLMVDITSREFMHIIDGLNRVAEECYTVKTRKECEKLKKRLIAAFDK